MHERRAELEELGAAVIGVSFEPPDELARVAAPLALPWPLYSDPMRSLYRAFGMASRDASSLYTWDALVAYVRGALRGQLPRLRPGADVEQLGGDVVLSPDGEVVFRHCSEDAADRPSVDALLRAIRDARSAAPAD